MSHYQSDQRSSKEQERVAKVLESCINARHFDSEAISRLLAQASCLRANVLDTLIALSADFQDEQVISFLGYPNSYEGPLPITEQILMLAEMLRLDADSALRYADSLPTLPYGAEGWFAVSSPEAILGNQGWASASGRSEYRAAVETAFERLVETRRGYNLLRVPAQHDLQPNTHAKEGLRVLGRQQPGEIWIIAAQLGLRHRGRSVRRAEQCYLDNEFGLSTLSAICILLGHPDRIGVWGEVVIDCGGDRLCCKGNIEASGEVPTIGYNDDGLQLSVCDTASALALSGPATVFLP